MLISITDVVKKYGLSYQAVNYYTALGLLEVKDKKGNKRYYDSKDVKIRLLKIKKYKSRGYPLRLIRNELL